MLLRRPGLSCDELGIPDAVVAGGTFSLSRHILIAGTGRAGTSFLVKYLTRLGLETKLSRNRDVIDWDDAAQAGLEDVMRPNASFPYVIKSPWSFQVIDEVLRRGDMQFDAVIVPMRDLTEAAASRTIVEMQAMYRDLPWMGDLSRGWEYAGHTPGGVIYSLSPVDQARLLAVGFHQLLLRLVQAEVPLVLLEFPRLIEDAGYLVRKLLPVLPGGISEAAARDAHRIMADRSMVRVGRELQRDETGDGFHLDFPPPEKLERLALLRLVAETRRSLQMAREEVSALRGAAAAQDTSLARAHEELRQTQTAVADAEAAAMASIEQREDLLRRLSCAEDGLTQANAEVQRLRAQLVAQETEASQLRAQISAPGRRTSLRFSAMRLWLSSREEPDRPHRSAARGR
jgi:hypothetical protein